MQDVTVYQVGGRFWSLRKLLREHQVLDQAAKTYQKLDMLMSTVSLEHSPGREATANQDEDTAFIARILLGILQRGHASIVSPFVESCILRGGWADAQDADKPVLEPALPIPIDQAETFARDVIAALIGGEQRTSPDWTRSYDSQSERRFFEHHLHRLLGPGVALVEAQRPLPSMLPEQDSRRFNNQRVDFALETPDGLRIVFEIDGPVHRGADGSQLGLDRERTRALQREKWIVERIPADRVWQDSDVFSSVVRAQVADNPTLKTLREGPEGGLTTGVESPLAYRCAIGPHAVARIQLAVLLAMLRGELSLQDPEWRIGVIERDLASAEVAIADLLDQVTHLCALYGINARPRIRLVIVPAYTPEPQGTSRRLAWTPIDIHYVEPEGIFGEINTLDLLIDVSVRTRPRDVRPVDPLPAHHLRGMVTLYELRTAYRRLPEAFIEWPAPRPVPDPDATEPPLRYFLQTLFRRPDFLPKQLDVMKRAMLRKDVLGLLPTGGGKSLTFQLPTLLSPGVTLVIAPLKSLIDDQMDNLHRAGINRVGGIHSGFGKERKERAIQEIVSGYPRFVYISPERLHIKGFREDLRTSPIARSLAFSVVDEAHCVSEWGHDFRPAYLSVAHQARDLFVTDAGVPPIIALTATASNTVLTDIIRELHFDPDDREALVSVTTFDRGELQFIPITGTPENKRRDLERAIVQVAAALTCEGPMLLDDCERAGIVFCRYVNGNFGVMGVSTHLQSLHGWGDGRVQIYAGGQPKKWPGPDPWEDHKRRVQRGFKDNKFPALVATSSFGMGIDKENIRYTIHYGIPQSLEALAQEAGRAGRDRKMAACAIVYTDESLNENGNYLAPDLSTEEARQRAGAVPRKDQGDASRIMFLLGTSYPGVDQEAATLTQTFDAIRAAWDDAGITHGETLTQTLKRPYGDPASGQFDKALYRLTALGVITDYTVDYAARTVEIQTERIDPVEMERNLRAFVRRYGAEEAVGEALDAAAEAVGTTNPYTYLLRAICIFAYRVIETARRESLRNVVSALRDCNGDGKALSQRLNEFLSNNTFTARVAAITRGVNEFEWFQLVHEAHNLDLAIQLVNAADRELESNPTHAGLHLLSGLGNVQRDTIPSRVIAERIMASLNYYETTFGKSPAERRLLIRNIMDHISSARRDRLDDLVATLLRLRDDDDVARAAYPHVTLPDLRRRCAVPWLRDVRNRAYGMRAEVAETRS